MPRNYTSGKSDKELIGNIGFDELVEVNRNAKRKVLVTGAGSYIGEYFHKYANDKYSDNFEIDELDMLNHNWKKRNFSDYDIVYHVAGIAHADVGNVSDEVKEKYYEVNTDLTVDVAKKAKAEGVRLFVFMSSMIVYGESAPYGKEKIIDAHTVPVPANFYGDSKLQADVAVRQLADENFKVAVIRPPMIYGKGSKGNYPLLAKLAKKIPVFPKVNNQRSMLYVENLCEFLCQLFLVDVTVYNKSGNVFIPQNAEWTNTAEMVNGIAQVSGKKIHMSKILTPVVFVGGKMPGKIGGLVNKAFGNSCYDMQLSNYKGIEYSLISLKRSIDGAEGK